MHTLRRTMLCRRLLLVAPQPQAVFGCLLPVGPSGQWCTVVNNGLPGEAIVLRSGSYTTPCRISIRGIAMAWRLVRSVRETDRQRATVAYAGTTSHVPEIRAAAYMMLHRFS